MEKRIDQYEDVEEKVIRKKLRSAKDKEYVIDDVNRIEPLSLEELRKNINEMEHSAQLTACGEIVTNFKWFSGAVIFVKKIIRKCMRWYVEPVYVQQTTFNNASLLCNVNMLSALEESREGYDLQKEELWNQKEELWNQKEELWNQKEELWNQKEELKLAKEEMQIQIDKLEELQKEMRFVTERNIKIMERMEGIREEAFKISDENFWLSREVYAQSGEDVILEYILMVLGISVRECRYLDLGANHAKELSNTYSLYRKGARGVLVEANPALIPELKFYRHEDIIVNKCISKEDGEKVPLYIVNGDGLVSANKESVDKALSINKTLKLEEIIEVETVTINTLLEQYFVQGPEIMSVDIEGESLNVLKSMDWEHYRPLIVIVEMIEYSTTLNIDYKDKDIQDFMEMKGYTEYAFTGINSIYVDRSRVIER